MSFVSNRRPAWTGWRPGRVVATVCAAAVLSVFAGAAPLAAEPRAHQVTWGHSAPATVARFIVYISRTEGDVEGARQVDIGKPSGQSAGSVTYYSAVVSFEEDEYLAVVAEGRDGQRSAPSTWFAMPPTRPGQPNLADQ